MTPGNGKDWITNLTLFWLMYSVAIVLGAVLLLADTLNRGVCWLRHRVSARCHGHD